MAKKIIPGGTQLLAKRPELYLPGAWPAYYRKAKGCQIWDLDGKKYIDMSLMGVGSCILGYADEDVNAAVGKAVKTGNMCTLNVPEEVELAKLLIKIHPWAQMVRYARTGGEAMSIAVRIARAFSRKDAVLFCGYHGWHDWYISAYSFMERNIGHLQSGEMGFAGVPMALRGTAYPFKFNDRRDFLSTFNKHKGKVGAVVLEVVRGSWPEEEFIKTIREVTRKTGVVLILDEITSGFRLCPGGAHLLFGLIPDIAVFSKAISNGFPMAAVIGTKNVMRAAEKSFISSTYWTERVGPVAALATITKMRKIGVPQYLAKIGEIVQDGWKRMALKHGMDLEVSGTYPLGYFNVRHKHSDKCKKIFTAFMLQKGFLATNSFYASYAHKTEHLERYLNLADKAFAFIKKNVL